MIVFSEDPTIGYNQTNAMWWDSCGGSLDVSLGFIERKHSCSKDEEIVKVRFENFQ